MKPTKHRTNDVANNEANNITDPDVSLKRILAALKISKFDLPEAPADEEPLAQDEQTQADALLQQILDELESEEAADGHGASPPSTSSSSSSTPRRAQERGEESDTPTAPQDAGKSLPAPSFPELPSTPQSDPQPLPQSRGEAGGDDDDGEEGEEEPGLQLPCVPTAAPTAKGAASRLAAKLPAYTDEDIESWCVICSDDAAVRCTGCDGDLYCRKCWSEGHVGPDVGYEERTHRWAKYVRKKG